MKDPCGQTFLPVSVQQNEVHPSQHRPDAQLGHRITDWAETGRVRYLIGATAIAHPASATRPRKLLLDTSEPTSREARRVSVFVTSGTPGTSRTRRGPGSPPPRPARRRLRCPAPAA